MTGSIDQDYLMMRDGGLFLFDFWHGPAVLAEQPERRVKELENEKIKVVRHCEPVLHEDRYIVDVHYDSHISPHSFPFTPHAPPVTSHSSLIKEIHPMRYFFRPEPEHFLSVSGFAMLQCAVWMGDEEPTEKDWRAVVVASHK